jgi:thiamine biosynthesis lipoprotein
MALGRGIRNVVVNFGHDLRVHGEPPEGGPWRIGLEDPNDPGRCWGGVAVRDRAVTTSGDYLRHFTAGGVRYGHILDPRTGHPVNNGCRAVSVIAPTCTEAGILSTTAFILGAREGLEFLDGYYQAEGCIWHQDQRIETRRFDEYLIRS